MARIRSLTNAGSAIVFVIWVACEDAVTPSSPTPEPVEEPPAADLRARFELEPVGSVPYPPDNTRNPDRIELGRLLFFDPILGGEKDVACGTCHHPKFTFADGRQFGAGTSGVGLGPDRTVSRSSVTGDSIHLEPRNSPTVLNAAFNGLGSSESSHIGLQFWDGRVEGLEEQATKPITSRVEMRGDAYSQETAQDSVMKRLRSIEGYRRWFREAFPVVASELDAGRRDALIDLDTYGRALAAYERELVAVNSPYDRWLAGDDDAMTELQKVGLELFFTKAKCAACHSGPMFSNFEFIVNGVPQVGVGKDTISGDDTGREEHTRDSADRYAFRTPTIRNVELTAPYMHDGVFETLDEVVHFYNAGARPRHREITDDMLPDVLREPLGLTMDEVNALVAFMKALTDPGTEIPERLLTVPDSVPSGLEPVFGVRHEGR